jgi:hypothetical protein
MFRIIIQAGQPCKTYAENNLDRPALKNLYKSIIQTGQSWKTKAKLLSREDSPAKHV